MPLRDYQCKKSDCHYRFEALVMSKGDEPKCPKCGSKKVEKTMHEYKRGQLKSGRSGKTVKSRKQAIAIGLSKARKGGAKVPKAPRKRSKRS